MIWLGFKIQHVKCSWLTCDVNRVQAGLTLASKIPRNRRITTAPAKLSTAEKHARVIPQAIIQNPEYFASGSRCSRRIAGNSNPRYPKNVWVCDQGFSDQRPYRSRKCSPAIDSHVPSSQCRLACQWHLRRTTSFLYEVSVWSVKLSYEGTYYLDN